MGKNYKILLLISLIALFLAFFFRARLAPEKLFGSADLSWSASSDPDVAGYRIYYGENPRTDGCPPGGYPKNLDIKNGTSAKIESLSEGKTFYFSVTSYNKGGRESCFSEEGRKTIALGRWQKIKLIFNKIVGR